MDEDNELPATVTQDVAIDRAADVARMGLAAIGCVLTGIGAGLYWLPLGFAVPGLMIYAVSIIGSLRASK